MFLFENMTWFKKINHLLWKYGFVDKHISFINLLLPSPPATSFTKTPRIANTTELVLHRERSARAELATVQLLEILSLWDFEAWKIETPSYRWLGNCVWASLMHVSNDSRYCRFVRKCRTSYNVRFLLVFFESTTILLKWYISCI